MTKIFYPKPDSNKAKKILKLNRGQLKKLIELITGQNNLNYMNNKIYGSEDLCRFCEEEEETFDHIINDCPCFYLDRCDLPGRHLIPVHFVNRTLTPKTFNKMVPNVHYVT